MRTFFMCSLCHKGILGGGLYLDNQVLTFKTQKLTVSEKYRNFEMPLNNIEEITWKWIIFPVATFKMKSGECYKIITLEVMTLMIQFMSTIILQNVFLGILSFVPFVAVIGGFEYGYQKKSREVSEVNETAKTFRKKFYKISAWLGAYFPIRFVVIMFASFYPRPYSVLVLECVIAAVYFMTVMLITLTIEKKYLKSNQ